MLNLQPLSPIPSAAQVSTPLVGAPAVIVSPSALPPSKVLFDSGVALLAFVLAFYALAVRERRTPYAANSVYSTGLVILVAVFMSLSSGLLRLVGVSDLIIASVDVFAGGLLACGAFVVLYRLFWLNSRHVYFNDNVVKGLVPRAVEI